MISSSNLPPYNRFDKIPQHALQCGLTSEVDYIPTTAQHRGVDGKLCTKGSNHHEISDGNSSRESSVSFVTSGSQSTTSSQRGLSSISSLDSLLSPIDSVMKHLSQNLYIEQTAPPSYNNRHEQSKDATPNRMELPKKSQAAQQRAAEILQQTGKVQKPFGHCYSCKEPILTSNLACQAMGQLYHTKCFTCCSCGRTLREKAFYCIQGKIHCEDDYMYSGFQQTIEKCHSCGHLIMDMILQALGRSYHPGCFRCTSCNECLDGVPFTVDIENNVYCITDFHRLFAPKCAACGLAIIPIDSSDETVRVVALDKDYHIDCYHCEKCKMQLTDEVDKRCYPIGNRLLCYNCHIDVRGLRVSSPSASSTSSHSSSSHTSHQTSSPTSLPNGTPLRKPPSPLATQVTNPQAIYWPNTTPNSPPPVANSKSLAQTSNYSNIPDGISSNRTVANNISTAIFKMSPPGRSTVPKNGQTADQHNPNTRLHQKIMMHLEANKDFTPKTPSHPGMSTSTRRRSGPSAGRTILTSPQLHGTTPHTTVEHNRPVPPIALQQKLAQTTSMTREVQIRIPNTEENIPFQIAPRSVAVEHAVPPFNLRRMQGSRRRLPLSDMIMHKKIAESLKKTISSGQSLSPSSDLPCRSTPSSTTVQPPRSPTSPLPPAPPYYMKAWQASEVAQSAELPAAAIEQPPVTAQELPPRLPTRGQDRPPERPPKLRSTHIEKF